MDDLISRKDALKALDEMSYKSPHESATSVVRKKHFGEILEKFIMQQPTAQQWIPCSERLPYSQEDVLCDEDGHVILGFYTDEEIGWHDTHSYRIYPTAWMPLPSPYREETES